MDRNQKESESRFDAAIFDLDGVVTRTARLHAAAWKRLFDEFLSQRSKKSGEPFVPFDVKADYLATVDGKPRYEGVRGFLESRGIDLPLGSKNDGPDRETIYGLGNRKDGYFAERLDRDGVEVFDTTIKMIQALRGLGIRVGMVTSSKHGREIVRRAGLQEIFDVEFDGNDGERLRLDGKPNPDTFLETARMLGVEPERVVVFEDAVSGVQAGRRGGFGLVVGVDRGGNRAALESAEADFVVSDLSELTVERLMNQTSRSTTVLPGALEHLSEIEARLRDRRPAIFLDYDGTLTPIVARPELAVLATEMRETVRRLARKHAVAVVSGRGLADVINLVGIEELYYAGNHGFEIRGPGGTDLRHEIGGEFLPALARARAHIAERIRSIPGAFVEDKTYSLSVHYRQSPEERVAEVEASVDAVLAEAPKLRKHLGKKVFEVRPRIEWDKGRAVLYLLKALGLDSYDVLPIYVGDDITDEDAFRALAGTGLGFLVVDEPRPSAASYALRNTDETRRLLEALADIPGREKR
jgi:trehalose 6-phosphate phosphatase